VALIATMLVIVTTPVRSSWADRSLPADAGLRRLVPAVLSAALATTLVLLFLQYANAIVFDSANIVGALSTVDEGFTASLVTSVAVTNLVLLIGTAYFAAGPVTFAPEVGGGHPEAVVELYAGVPSSWRASVSCWPYCSSHRGSAGRHRPRDARPRRGPGISGPSRC
jgi:hypothetical protein